MSPAPTRDGEAVAVQPTPSAYLHPSDAELLRLVQALNQACAWLDAEIERLPDDDGYDRHADCLCAEYVVRVDPLIARMASMPSASLAGAAAKMAWLVAGSLSQKRGRSLPVSEYAVVDSLAADLRRLLPDAFAAPAEARAADEGRHAASGPV